MLQTAHKTTHVSVLMTELYNTENSSDNLHPSTLYIHHGSDVIYRGRANKSENQCTRTALMPSSHHRHGQDKTVFSSPQYI